MTKQPNQSQRALLRERGVASFDELPIGSIARVEYANRADFPDEPDPTPAKAEPEVSEAQRVYLSTFPDGLASMDALQRDVFDRMGAGTPQTGPAARPAKSAEPRLDPAKIAGLSPTRRAELHDHVQTLIQNHREAMRGIDPSARETARWIEEAKAHAVPYLLD